MVNNICQKSTGIYEPSYEEPLDTMSTKILIDTTYPGGTYVIEWDKDDIGEPYVFIELFEENEFVKLISAHTTNNGEYRWHVPPSISDGKKVGEKAKTFLLGGLILQFKGFWNNEFIYSQNQDCRFFLSFSCYFIGLLQPKNSDWCSDLTNGTPGSINFSLKFLNTLNIKGLKYGMFVAVFYPN